MRFRRRPEPLPVELLYTMFAVTALWLTVVAAQAGLAGAATSKIATPRQLAPADAAGVGAVPSFSWRAVKRAAKYEFQLSADAAFESIVLGRGRGSFFTRNTWATVGEALADGRYFWRVRAVDARDRAGRWSPVRSIHKRWTDTPVPLGPTDGGTITYPSTRPVLRWEPIPRAYKYVLTIATDRQLANPVALSSTSKLGIETSGTVYALQKPLAPGTYYWAVTPLDGQKHPGTRSAVWSFKWEWPTKLASTQMSVVDLDADPAKPDACATSRQCLDPQLHWDPIAGAARYQVEISQLEQHGSDPGSFPAGSVVCCSEPTTGTSLSPTTILANNSGTGIPGDPDQFGYWWRVRAIDADGNAGEWNYGQPFDKTYPIRVTGLHLRDHLGDVPVDQDPGTAVVETSSPAIVWNQTQGAASYEVNVVPYAQATPSSPFRCDWSARTGAWYVVTAGTAWTPLGNPGGRKPLGVLTNLTPSRDVAQPISGMSYCVRVKPRRNRDAKGKEVVGDWATMGEPAFRYVAPPAPAGTTLALRDDDYLQPTSGQEHSWIPPLFTWKPVDGARGYFVVVARDRSFSKIVDIAYTNVTAYAPRRGANPATYPDEGSYWWAVLPTELANGDFSAPLTAEDCEQPCEPTVRRLFTKRSTPPAPITPVNEQVVAEPPMFRWKAALGARSYTLQVDQDPAFSSPIVTVTTDSTAYTSSHAMPADTALYWRVRANDELGTGLSWSPTMRFRRTLPIPVADPGNPTGGEVIPVLAWTPVQGAVSYDMHVEQVDGTKRDFTIRSSAFTPVVFYGTGIWHWQVRANFPGGTRVVSGGYFAPQGFTRHIATPANLRTGKANGGIVLSWDPARMAKSYRVEIGTTDSFSRIVERATTDNTSWAPRMTSASFADAERLYWRVAAVDEGNNVGGWAAKPLRSAPRASIRLQGRLREGRGSVVRATVTGRKGRPLKGAIVRVQGAGVTSRARRTNRSGVVRLRLTPRGRGIVRFSAEKVGYSPARAKLRVR